MNDWQRETAPVHCAAVISDRWPTHCQREAAQEIEGRWYCKQHARSKANARKWEGPDKGKE